MSISCGPGTPDENVVIGIDPGLRATGFAVLMPGNVGPIGLALADCGDIKPSTTLPMQARLGVLFDALEAILARWRPHAVVVEKVYSEALFPNTAIVMGHVRGVICLATYRSGAELVEIPPAEVKKALTGNGRASKQQMGMTIARLLGLSVAPKSEHVADALALAAVGALRITPKDTGKQIKIASKGSIR